MRRAVLLLLLAGLVAPATAAQACDTVQVQSLDTHLPAAPAVVPAGRPMLLSLTVTRAGSPAAGVEVAAVLAGERFTARRSGVTGRDGTAVLRLDVPRTARGATQLDVEAHRTLADQSCASVEEHDRIVQPWGRAR